MKNANFLFDEKCHEAFEIIKHKHVKTLILVSPDWSLPFELMYDASNTATKAVLGRRTDGIHRVIYYASTTKKFNFSDEKNLGAKSQYKN